DRRDPRRAGPDGRRSAHPARGPDAIPPLPPAPWRGVGRRPARPTGRSWRVALRARWRNGVPAHGLAPPAAPPDGRVHGDPRLAARSRRPRRGDDRRGRGGAWTDPTDP